MHRMMHGTLFLFSCMLHASSEIPEESRMMHHASGFTNHASLLVESAWCLMRDAYRMMFHVWCGARWFVILYRTWQYCFMTGPGSTHETTRSQRIERLSDRNLKVFDDAHFLSHTTHNGMKFWCFLRHMVKASSVVIQHVIQCLTCSVFVGDGPINCYRHIAESRLVGVVADSTLFIYSFNAWLFNSNKICRDDAHQISLGNWRLRLGITTSLQPHRIPKNRQPCREIDHVCWYLFCVELCYSRDSNTCWFRQGASK